MTFPANAKISSDSRGPLEQVYPEKMMGREKIVLQWAFATTRLDIPTQEDTFDVSGERHVFLIKGKTKFIADVLLSHGGGDMTRCHRTRIGNTL